LLRIFISADAIIVIIVFILMAFIVIVLMIGFSPARRLPRVPAAELTLLATLAD
jgi:hypothetical protein